MRNSKLILPSGTDIQDPQQPAEPSKNTPLKSEQSPSSRADEEPSVQSHTEAERVYSFTGQRLTWDQSIINQVIYNKHIKEWMEYYPGFANWVRSCLMLHADNSKSIETVCRIPDQYREEIGETITITWDDCIPSGRKERIPVHEVRTGIIRVMA